MGGLAFGAILALVMKKRESKAKTIKNEIARSETIIAEGWADNGSGWGLMITEGYMLITDKGIRYINLGTGKHEIKQSLSHENIQSITKSGKKLIVASDNKNYGFRVSSPDKWLAAINCR